MIIVQEKKKLMMSHSEWVVSTENTDFRFYLTKLISQKQLKKFLDSDPFVNKDLNKSAYCLKPKRF